MGILSALPPALLAFLTWLVIWLASTITILIISIFVGRLVGEFLEGIMGIAK